MTPTSHQSFRIKTLVVDQKFMSTWKIDTKVRSVFFQIIQIREQPWFKTCIRIFICELFVIVDEKVFCIVLMRVIFSHASKNLLRPPSAYSKENNTRRKLILETHFGKLSIVRRFHIIRVYLKSVFLKKILAKINWPRNSQKLPPRLM